MTQPKFAPIPIEDEVRPSDHLPPCEPWRAERPADFRPGAWPGGAGTGVPGPDQGYVLRLAERFVEALVLVEGEHPDDVLAGAAVVALRRAALYGRAPVSADLELALGLFGFLGEAPADLVAERRKLFRGAAHDYWDQRVLAHRVPESALRLSPGAVRTDPALALLDPALALLDPATPSTQPVA